MSVIENYPSLRPSLLLDFVNSRRVHPLIQCVRASTATCYGPDGKLRTVANNVPRLDFDPLTGACLGLRTEEARVNLLANSVFAGAVAGTPGTAPNSYGFGVGNGTTEVVALGSHAVVRLKTSTAARHFLTQTNMPVEVGQYCLSIDCYFYVASRIIDAITVLMGTAVATLRYFVDGVEVTTNTQVSVGRRKLSVLMDVTTAGSIAPRFGVGVSTSVVGDVEIGIPQLELGGFSTSHIPTAATSLTRAADRVWMELPQLTPDGFTLVLDAAVNWVGEYAAILSDSPTNLGGFAGVRSSPTLNYINSTEGGRSGNVVGRPASGVPFKMAAAITNDATKGLVAVDGVVSIATAARTVADFSLRNILKLGGTTSVAQGASLIRRVAIYPRPLSAAQLQRLTQP